MTYPVTFSFVKIPVTGYDASSRPRTVSQTLRLFRWIEEGKVVRHSTMTLEQYRRHIRRKRRA